MADIVGRGQVRLLTINTEHPEGNFWILLSDTGVTKESMMIAP